MAMRSMPACRKTVGLGGERAELLDAVRAAFAEVEDDDHRPAGVVGEGMLVCPGHRSVPIGSAGEGLQRNGPSVSSDGRLPTSPAGWNSMRQSSGRLEFFGDGREALEDGALDVDVCGNVAQFFELLDGFLSPSRCARGYRHSWPRAAPGPRSRADWLASFSASSLLPTFR